MPSSHVGTAPVDLHGGKQRAVTQWRFTSALKLAPRAGIVKHHEPVN